MKQKYKIAIIGLGSIGKRHLVNIHTVLKDRDIECIVDIVTRKESHCIDSNLLKFISTIYTQYGDIPDDYDVVFITNPTNLHYDTIKKFNNKTKNMFIEKPVFNLTSLNVLDLELKKDSIYYVACPLRYTNVIQYIKNKIDLDSVYSVRSICSSYLPDWRPSLDYRSTYSAHQSKGGGASIDLIHEWDYLMYLFGKPTNIINYRGKFSHLEIDSDDLSIYIAKYNNMLLELHLDYFGRRPIRKLELFTRNETIIADIIKSEIKFLKQNKIINLKEDRNSYQTKELERFFDIVEGKSNNENAIYTALDTLKIAKDGKL